MISVKDVAEKHLFVWRHVLDTDLLAASATVCESNSHVLYNVSVLLQNTPGALTGNGLNLYTLHL